MTAHRYSLKLCLAIARGAQTAVSRAGVRYLRNPVVTMRLGRVQGMLGQVVDELCRAVNDAIKADELKRARHGQRRAA